MCPGVPEVSYEEVSKGVKDRGFLLLDVRTAAEVAEGIIPGARALPGYTQILTNMNSLIMLLLL